MGRLYICSSFKTGTEGSDQFLRSGSLLLHFENEWYCWHGFISSEGNYRFFSIPSSWLHDVKTLIDLSKADNILEDSYNIFTEDDRRVGKIIYIEINPKLDRTIAILDYYGG